MEKNDLDSFTLGLIQRTQERNKFLEQMNLTIESPNGSNVSSIGSPVDSKNGLVIGSPIKSRNVSTIKSPIRSTSGSTIDFKNGQFIRSPVASRNFQNVKSPIGSTIDSKNDFTVCTKNSPNNCSKNNPNNGSTINSKNEPFNRSPVSKNVLTIGSPVESRNFQNIKSPIGSTIDSKDGPFNRSPMSKNILTIGSPLRSRNFQTVKSPISSAINSKNASAICPKDSPVSCSNNPNNSSTIDSTKCVKIDTKNGLDINVKKDPTIVSKENGLKNVSKNDLRVVTDSKVDSTDPCLLPLAARRALFERKMCQPVSKVDKTEDVIGTFKATSQFPSKDDIRGSNVREVKDLAYDDVNINPKESHSNEPNISSKVDLSSDDENCNSRNQDSSDLNYSTGSDEKDPSYNDKNFGLNDQNGTIQRDINESIGFNASALLSTADENVSVIRQSTKIYPELPQSDELIEVHEASSEKDEHPLQNFISPIKGCDDDETMFVSPKKSVTADPAKSKSIQPTTPMRTLSMYRREQNIRKTIVSSVEEDELITDLETEATKREWLKKYNEQKSKKMEELKFEADKYNKIIYQSFRALDLCVQTNNVSERIEAEKILLVNMVKKNACVDELYRLQKEETFDTPMDPVGKITFKKLTLLVKGNFFVSQASGIDLCDYHFICLFTCGDRVIATDALSSSHAIQEASLNFTNKIVFDHLRKDFRIRLVIYALALPKGKRNHDKKNSRLTPRTKSKIKYTHSPALRASPRNEKVKCNFKKMGHVDFTRDNIMKSRFSLENFMFDSPLEDQIMVDLVIGCHYDIKFASYLNFHEISGEYPVWNRRWCVLNGPSIFFWRFSEDEGDKQPMGLINLKHCVNPSINKASTDICMRPNSFSFITLEKQDNSFIPSKHLMAADIRKERDGWLENLNKALEMIRLWEPDCLKPMDQASLDRLMK